MSEDDREASLHSSAAGEVGSPGIQTRTKPGKRDLPSIPGTGLCSECSRNNRYRRSHPHLVSSSVTWVVLRKPREESCAW